MLADGNPASVGDLIITRTNDRTPAHHRHRLGEERRPVDRPQRPPGRRPDGAAPPQRPAPSGCPPTTCRTSVELGYATTVHTAQGVTADTMHGLATGAESRQQLYTMLTRGRIANHLYLQVVGDGDPHSVIRPDTVHPSTATDLLEQILARDDAARSATTLQRDQHDPAVRLADAAARYVDALHVAAEDLAGRDVVDGVGRGGRADRARPDRRAGLAHPARPSAAARRHRHRPGRPAALQPPAAGSSTPPTTAPPSSTGGSTTPATATPAPDRCLAPRHPARAARPPGVGELPDRPIRTWSARWPTRSKPPSPTPIRPHGLPSAAACCRAASSGTCQVWRAAMQVSPEDRRPTGPVQLQKAARTWQRRLDRHVAGDQAPALQEWGWLLHQLSPNLTEDPFAPMLADRLAAISRAGVDARQLLRSAITTGEPLPDDHAAAALWWRISRHLTPAVAAQADTGHDRHHGPGPHG